MYNQTRHGREFCQNLQLLSGYGEKLYCPKSINIVYMFKCDVYCVYCIEDLSLVNQRDNYKNGSSRGFVGCLATSNDKNVIIAAKFDKCPYFDHLSNRDPGLYCGLYVILLFIEVFWFGTKPLCMIRLL